MPDPAAEHAPRRSSPPGLRLVHSLAREQGFGLVGIAPAQPSEHAEHVRRWIDAGRHGEMHYLAEHLDVRLDPRRLLPEARSIICVADFYPAESGQVAKWPSGQEKPDEGVSHDHSATPKGHVARYAWGDDYHKVMKKRLHHLADALRDRLGNKGGEQFRCVVDTAPALEREHALRAGLGWVGKHTLMIHPYLGSWMLLGLIVTTLELQSSAEAGYPSPTVPPTDHCGTCTRCIDACPTGCIENPAETGRRSIDASRCISYLTLEHRSLVDPGFHEAMGDWIAGCDVCQQVCPFNKRDQGSGIRDQEAVEEAVDHQSAISNRQSKMPLPIHPRYAPRAHLAEGLPLLEVLGWDVEDRQEAFRGSALKRVKLDMLKRNALIAAGNALARAQAGNSHAGSADASALRQRIKTITTDPDEPELVRITAKQVLERLADPARANSAARPHSSDEPAPPPHAAAPPPPPSAE